MSFMALQIHESLIGLATCKKHNAYICIFSYKNYYREGYNMSLSDLSFTAAAIFFGVFFLGIAVSYIFYKIRKKSPYQSNSW